MAHKHNMPTTDPALRTIMEASPVGIVVFDHDARVVYANDLAGQIFGQSADFLVGKSCGEFLACQHRHSDPRGCGHTGLCPSCPFYQAIQAVLSGNADPDKTQGEASVQLEGDLPPMWLKFKANGIVLDGHKAVVMAMDDITKSKRDEAALKESENRFRLMFMNAPMPYQSLDEQGNFIEVNQTFQEVLGYTRQDLIGKNFADILHPDWVDHFKRNFPRFKAIGEVLGVEFEMIKKDGTTIQVFFNGKIQRDAQGRFERTHCIFQDITERKYVEKRSLEREQYLTSILQTTADGFLVVDRNGKLVDVNDAYCRMSGYTQTELLAMTINELDAMETPDETQERIRHIIANGSALFETRHRRKDGSLFDIEMSVTYQDIQGGQFICFGRDITERKRFEKALRDSEDKLLEAHRIARLGRWDLDLSTGHLLWSDGIFDLFETRPEHFAASYDAFFDFVHPDDRALVHNAFQDSVEKKEPYEIEHRLLMNDGRVKWVNEIGRCEYDDSGNPLRSYGTVQDITERKMVEEKLRERNLFIETVLDNLPIGLAVNRIQEGVPTYINRQFESIYGWPKEEITDIQTFFAKVYPDPTYRNQLQDRVLKDIATGDPARMRWENIEATGKDGAKRIITAQNIPLVEQNIMISTVQDETQRAMAERQRNRLQEQLAQAQKMESVGRLAGGVAHDYNNMLSVIVGYTEMALEKTRPDDPLHDDLSEVYKAAQRSTDITRQLLAFARKQTIDPKIIDLNDIVESMLRMLRRLIGEEIDLIWHPGKQLWPVKIDPAQVDQILVNLCINARDAIGGVGEVAIETGNISVDENNVQPLTEAYPGDFVMLAVSDDGCGMDTETLGHIFEPFFTTKGISEGTGLGLPMVYGIVKQNKGFVNVYSEPGKGTTFRIYLPKHAGPQTRPLLMDKTKAPCGRGETVLLVEDEPAIMRMGEMMLQRLGYHVLAAGTPGQAIQMAAAHKDPIDLLITDVVMPEMNGRHLSEQLNQLYPGIRTLFMSGYTANVIAHRGVLDEGMHFLQKPFSMQDLAMKVRRVLDEQ